MSRKCSVIEFTRRGFFCVKTDGTTVPALSFRLPGRPLNKTPTRESLTWKSHLIGTLKQSL